MKHFVAVYHDEKSNKRENTKARMLYTSIRVVERTVAWHIFRKLALQKNIICDKHEGKLNFVKTVNM